MIPNRIKKWEDKDTGFRYSIYDHRPEPHPSPSSILGLWKWDSGGLDNWRAKVGIAKSNAIRDASAAIGTMLHDAFENYTKGVTVEVPEKYKALYTETCQWIDKQEWKEVIGTEVSLVHLDHVFGGTVDLIVRTKKDKIRVIDYKTGDLRGYDPKKHTYFRYSPSKMVKTGEQMAAYAKAYESMTGIKVDELQVVNPSVKTNRMEATNVYTHIDYLYKGFLHRLEAWKHENFNMLVKGFYAPGDEKILLKWDMKLVLSDFLEQFNLEQFNQGGK